jgi:uncharacterized damage-inducible protein DinB
MNRLLQNMVDHMRWADDLVGSALERQAQPDPQAARWFAHIASVEHLWYSRIRKEPAQHAVWPELSVDAARRLAARHADLFEQLVRDPDDGVLSRVVDYRNSAGHDFTNQVSDIVAHTALHGSHHRGQIAQRLRSLGRDPPHVDYIEFIRRPR